MAQPPFFDVRMKGFRDRTEVADAIGLLDLRVTTLPAETISIDDAAGRMLANDVVADVAVPAFDRAAMDGYALRAEETFGAGPYSPLEFAIIGEALPARPYPGTVSAAQAVRIMTGAPLPKGADAVLPAEAADEDHGRLRVIEPISPQRHVGRRGEDIAPGQLVLRNGRVLRPPDLGLLASIGVRQVNVPRQPSIDILVTGDELLPIGSKPEGYRIVDSNSVMLAALARRDGADVRSIHSLPDQRQRIRDAMLKSPGEVLLISGGSS